MSQATQQMPQFDEATRQELSDFIEQEQAKAKIQSSVHELTDKYWPGRGTDTSVPVCITGSISSKFSKSEASCLENCVDRFLDTSLYIVKQIEEQKSHLG
ncbi:Mitochondrial import inner membrane translocase subunit tim8 [Apiotrichum porosum]|uniref:Mitochondrial import inner membrane translocase subunit n=1 Tax=Apiotrichum porosum TaxID=105984 RepID=A0A427XGC6_9TREE|nr:Mitochondrial import inner membrane translocase subunit tim8 [Apiotrichum porosum]RSH77764.1 Mitochondrial import inner membrane translocase subunit tim8 [Apiotrichum porosum]